MSIAVSHAFAVLVQVSIVSRGDRRKHATHVVCGLSALALRIVWATIQL